jgi:hypothetical protein
MRVQIKTDDAWTCHYKGGRREKKKCGRGKTKKATVDIGIHIYAALSSASTLLSERE